MRLLVLFVFVAFAAAVPLFAGDAYLPIAGSVGVFRTDARLFNPSFDQEIDVVARFLPVGNVPNVGRPGITLKVGARKMMVLDDVVATVFNTSGLGAIHLSSARDFVVTSRIYAQTSTGTLGQFLTGHEPAEKGVSRGLLLHLKSNTAFRSNIGLVNLGTTAVTVRVQLYDRNNEPAGTPSPIVLEPLGVIGPTNAVGGFFGAPGSADLSDAWARVTTASDDQRVLAYASVIDNATTDPVFIPAVRDSGTAPDPPPQTVRTFEIDARQWDFDIRPGGSLTAQVGDRVVLRLRSLDVSHGFSMSPFVPNVIVGSETTEVSFDASQAGTFTYFCTVSTCGEGHTTMAGTMTIAPKP